MLLATIGQRFATAWEHVTHWLHTYVAPPLKTAQAPIDEFFGGLPLWVGKVSLICLFVLAAVWAISLKREFVYLGAPDQARWRDLRLWALAVLAPYVFIYWWLG